MAVILSREPSLGYGPPWSTELEAWKSVNVLCILLDKLHRKLHFLDSGHSWGIWCSSFCYLGCSLNLNICTYIRSNTLMMISIDMLYIVYKLVIYPLKSGRHHCHAWSCRFAPWLRKGSRGKWSFHRKEVVHHNTYFKLIVCCSRYLFLEI